MRNFQQVRSARLRCCRCCSCVEWNGDNNEMLSSCANECVCIWADSRVVSCIEISKAWICDVHIRLDENNRIWHLASPCGIECRQVGVHCSCCASDKHPIKVARRVCRPSGWDIKTHLSRDVHSSAACECSKICEHSRSLIATTVGINGAIQMCAAVCGDDRSCWWSDRTLTGRCAGEQHCCSNKRSCDCAR